MLQEESRARESVDHCLEPARTTCASDSSVRDLTVTPHRSDCGKATSLPPLAWMWQSISPGKSVWPGFDILVPENEIGSVENLEILPCSTRTEPESIMFSPSKIRTSEMRKEDILTLQAVVSTSVGARLSTLSEDHRGDTNELEVLPRRYPSQVMVSSHQRCSMVILWGS